MIFLSLGSNLPSKFGDRFDNLNLALLHLESYKISIVKKSSFYETLSYPDKKKPKFINMVICVKSHLTPVDLLSALISVEKKLGRERSIKNEPRICDIDIIDYEGKIYNLSYNEHKLFIPHKQLTLRNFVLYPLQEINPEWKHPESNESINTLIENLSNHDRKSILKIKKN